MEREILKLLLPLRHAVVATGGGTFMDAENRTAMNMDGVSVWLDVPFDRVAHQLAGGESLVVADLGRRSVFCSKSLQIGVSPLS